MTDLSIVNVNGTVYNIKDEQARQDIATLQSSISGGMHFIGEAMQFANAGPVYIKSGTSTAYCYYTGTKPTATTITISGTQYTLTYIQLKAGDVCIYGQLEFVFSDADNTFHEFGSTGSLKALAFKDSVSTTYKPKGSVTTTLTKTAKTLTHTVTQGSVSASGSYTPEGTISQGTAGTTDTAVKSYPGASSKMVVTTLHDTPTLNTGTVAKADVLSGVSLNTQKLVTTTIKGVAGTTQVSKASATSFNGITASVSGETLYLTTNSITFTNTTVATANSTNTTVATGSLSNNGTGAAVGTGVTPATTPVIRGIDSDGGEITKVGYSLTPGTAKTVATGSLASTGTGSAVLTGLGTPTTTTVLKTIGTLNFTGKAKTVSVSGSTNGVAIADHSIETPDSATSTFNGTSETIVSQ